MQLDATGEANGEVLQEEGGLGCPGRAAPRTVGTNERHLRAILDALPARVSLVDAAGRVVVLNEAAAAAMGTTVERGEGRRIASLDGAAERQADREVLKTGRPQLNAVGRKVDGAGRETWLHTDRYALASGNETQLLTVATDVTRFKTIEDELREANESLDRFATLVSHDLLTPLSRVSSWLSVLKHAMEDVDAPDARTSLSEMDAGLVRMRGLVERLLAFSRDTVQALRLETVVLADLLHALHPWDADNITLVDATNGMAVVGDAVLLSQVFENLVGNARKYAPRSTLTVRARMDGEWCTVEVEDDGPGIDQAESERIFGSFYRSRSRSRSGAGADGYGVGLVSCRRIVRAHGGDIRHDAGFTGGARFVVRLRPA